MRLPVKQTNEQLTPNGTTVSPAGSQSSASSGVPNNRDNGLRQDVAANSQPKQITLTVDLVSNVSIVRFRPEIARLNWNRGFHWRWANTAMLMMLF